MKSNLRKYKKWKKSRRDKLRKKGKNKSRLSINLNEFDQETYFKIKDYAHSIGMSLGNYITSLMNKINIDLLEELQEKKINNES